MNKKVIGILVCTLMIVTSILPVAGNLDYDTVEEQRTIFNEEPLSVASNIDWWSMFHHDPQLTGYSTSFAPGTNDISWTNTIEAYLGGSCSPAIVDDKLYIGTSFLLANNYEALSLLETIQGKNKPLENLNQLLLDSLYGNSNPLTQDFGTFYCLNANNGTEIWNFLPEEEGEFSFTISSPTVSNGKVYISFSPVDDEWQGRLYCLDAATGDKIWNLSFSILPEFYYSNPVVVDDKLYLASIEINGDTVTGKMTCFNSLNGNTIWEYIIGENELLEYSTPAVAYGKVYFLTTFLTEEVGGNIYCLNANTGDEIWKSPTVSALTSPTISDGYVYVSSYNVTNERGILLRLDAEDGEEIWRYTMPYNIISAYSSPAVAYGKVYIATIIGIMEGCKILCIDAENGELKWSKTISDEIMVASPAIADEKFYIASWLPDSILYCFNANTGDDIWNYPLGDNYMGTMCSPAVANGSLYMANELGTIYSFKDDNISPNPPSIDGPATGNVGNPYTYTFTSTDPDGDQVSYYIDWGDGIITDWAAFQPSGPPGYSESHTWNTQGAYTIKAKVKDVNNAESSWTAYPVLITNLAPDAPEITGQTSGKVGKEYEYTFNAVDPEGSFISEYIVNWGDGGPDETITGPFTSGADVYASHTWDEQGAFIIKAKAIDEYGAEGEWSALSVIMPRNRAINLLFLQLLEKFPLLEKLISSLFVKLSV